MSVFLQGLALTLPAAVERLSDGAALAAAAEGFETFGVAGAEEGLALMVRAVEAACRDAGVDPEAVDDLICLRNLTDERLDGAWLSVAIGAQLGFPGRCMDLRACACAGFAHGVDVAARLVAGGGRAIVVGGGASGFRRRWLDHEAEFDTPPPESLADVPVLLGDGAYAAVVGAEAGRYRVLASAVALDTSFADAHVVIDGETRPRCVDDKRRWRDTAPVQFARALQTAAQAAGRTLRPATLIGTNCGVSTKQRLFTALATDAPEPHRREALAAQLQQMREIGHLFGGDMVANLLASERAGAIRPGDTIVGVEFGEMYFTSVLALEAEARR